MNYLNLSVKNGIYNLTVYKAINLNHESKKVYTIKIINTKPELNPKVTTIKLKKIKSLL